MQKLPGLIEIQNNISELTIWDALVSILGDKKGILGYQFPSVGVVNTSDIPTFIIRSEEIGIIILNVVDKTIVEFLEDEFWKTSDGEEIYSPDIILTNFSQEIKNRLSKDSLLYDRKQQKLLFNIRQFLIFSKNTKAEIESVTGLVDNLINEYIVTDEFDTRLNTILNEEYKIESNLMSLIDSLLEGTDSYNKSRREKSVLEPKTIQEYIKKSVILNLV